MSIDILHLEQVFSSAKATTITVSQFEGGQSNCSGDINIFEDLPNTVTANTYTYLLLPAPTLAHLSVETVKQFLNRCE